MVAFSEKLGESSAFLSSFLRFEDNRGDFTKVFDSESFDFPEKDTFIVRQCFVTKSTRDVIRGMHFQCGEYEANRIVSVLSGSVIDVILSIDPSSPDYGKYFYTRLGEGCQFNSIYIPSSYAHGFLACSDDVLMAYLLDRPYYVDCDSGYLWNSFGFRWPVTAPIISHRDQLLPKFPSDLG